MGVGRDRGQQGALHGEPGAGGGLDDRRPQLLGGHRADGMVGVGQGVDETGQPRAVRVEVGPHGDRDPRTAVGDLRRVQERGDEPLPFPRVAAEREHLLELVHDDEQFVRRRARLLLPGEDLPHRPVEGARVVREAGVHRAGTGVGAGREPDGAFLQRMRAGCENQRRNTGECGDDPRAQHR